MGFQRRLAFFVDWFKYIVSVILLIKAVNQKANYMRPLINKIKYFQLNDAPLPSVAKSQRKIREMDEQYRSGRTQVKQEKICENVSKNMLEI